MLILQLAETVVDLETIILFLSCMGEYAVSCKSASHRKVAQEEKFTCYLMSRQRFMAKDCDQC